MPLLAVALHLLVFWSTVVAWPSTSSFRLRERQQRQLKVPSSLPLPAAQYEAETPEARKNQNNVVDNYYIRDCNHADLSSICDLVMESFFFQHDDDQHHNCWDKEFIKLEKTFQDMTMQNHWNKIAQNYMIMACQEVPNNDADAADIDNQKIIGFVHLDNRPPLPNACLKHCPRPIVTDLMVSKSMQRKGVARRLMMVCEEIARQQENCPSLYLRVVDTNHAAIQFYKRIGFQYRPDMWEDSRPDLMVFEKPLSQ